MSERKGREEGMQGGRQRRDEETTRRHHVSSDQETPRKRRFNRLRRREGSAGPVRWLWQAQGGRGREGEEGKGGWLSCPRAESRSLFDEKD